MCKHMTQLHYNPPKLDWHRSNTTYNRTRIYLLKKLQLKTWTLIKDTNLMSVIHKQCAFKILLLIINITIVSFIFVQ